jgi:FkbM family methyltransferase
MVRAAGPAEAKMKLGHRLVLDPRAHTERLAYLTGEYDTQTIRALMTLFCPDWVVLDVGANVGFFAVPFALRLKALGGHIHCFEPLPGNAERLSQNLALNGLGPYATVWTRGLSDRSRTQAITLREDFLAGATTGNASLVIEDGQDSAFPTATISLETLDDLADKVCPERCDLIKVDIEGHEDLFFKGGLKTIEKHRPVILAEMNAVFLRRRGVDPDHCIGILFSGLQYVLAVQRGAKWVLAASTKARRRPTDDMLLLPGERAESVLFQLNRRHIGGGPWKN